MPPEETVWTLEPHTAGKQRYGSDICLCVDQTRQLKGTSLPQWLVQLMKIQCG